MKKYLAAALAVMLLLTGCAAGPAPETTEATPVPSEESVPVSFSGELNYATGEIPCVSRFASETVITLSDEGVSVEGDTQAVFTSHDIIYYEDRDAYESGYPYGEGEVADKHTAQEASSHTVVNITAPGAYRLMGKLSAGQIRVDLGDSAYYDETAVVELILDNADITCTVAPAILFLNTYECDGAWSADTAASDVDTSAAGANLILEGDNTVSGSYVARIYKDGEGEKKLWKQDGAIYSYMSMNVFGPGSLSLNAANEGLDTELHLTINGGNIAIRSGNDGINTNEDGVSVTTINGGCLHITAGLGEEGDGIDSNGWLVVNGGTVVSSANPAADAGLDSDMGSFVNGGTVIALGSTMDWAESDSGQATMNLQFAEYRDSGSAIVVTRQDGTVVFAYDPSEDEILNRDTRRYMGAILSCPGFAVGESYHVYLDGTLTGNETGGIYTGVTGYDGGIQMQYTGTDLGMGFGGGQRPGGFGGGWAPQEGEMPTLPEGETFPQGQMPEGFPGGEMPEGMEPPEGMEQPEGSGEGIPEGFEGMEPPEGMELPEGMEIPEGFEGGNPGGQRPQGGQDRPGQTVTAATVFTLTDKVNAFSGVTAAQ